MELLVTVVFGWVLLSLPVALVLGRCIRLAEHRAASRRTPLSTADLPDGFTPVAGLARR